MLAILVQNLKGTVTLITNVAKVSNPDVDQTIAQLLWDLMQTQIAVIMQLIEMRISAQLMILVMLMKVTVIPMMNAKVPMTFVDQTIVLAHLVFHLQSTVVNQKVINQYLLFFDCPYNLGPFFNY